jgi:hypothetical protein
MPFVIPFIPLIAAAATTGTTIGLDLANQPSGTPPKPTTTPAPLTQPQNAAQTAAVSSALPTLQAQTGGSVSPEYAAQWGASQSGLGNDPQATGNIQAAINNLFGLNAGGNSGLTPASSSQGGGDILSALSRPQPNPVSPSPGGGGGSDIFSQLLSGGDFKGLLAGA